MISCRVFRKGVCKKTRSNIILVNKSISSNTIYQPPPWSNPVTMFAGSHKCQQFCFASQGCAAFTHFEQSKAEDRKCVLFRDCNGKLAKCEDCIR